MKKFEKPPLPNLNFQKLMAAETHHISADSSNHCVYANLSICYEIQFPSRDQILTLTSPLTATDPNEGKCLILAGTTMVASEVVMVDYPMVEVQNNLMFCDRDKTCHSLLKPLQSAAMYQA